MLNIKIDYKIKGYTGRWSLIDKYQGYGLFENNTWGDETCYLVVKLNQKPITFSYRKKDGTYVNLPTIMEVVCETYDDLIQALEDEGII